MKWLKVSSEEQQAYFAANVIESRVQENPRAHLCLATGHSPLATYQELSRRSAANDLDLKHINLSKLDEWLGVPMTNPVTCEFYLQKYALQPWAVAAENYLSFDGEAADPAAECERVAIAKAAKGSFDLSVLGVGVNGHLGLNEPADQLVPHAHVALLAQITRSHPMIAALNPAPTKGLTFGIQDILESKSVLLLIAGRGKEAATAALKSGPTTTQIPVTLLRDHANVTIIECTN